MKSFLHRFRTSLPTRLSLGVVLFAALIFITAFGYMFIVSRKAVEREAVERATQILNNTVEPEERQRKDRCRNQCNRKALKGLRRITGLDLSPDTCE